MQTCKICNKKIWFWQDEVTDQRDNKTEYHLRCVLWNNRREVKETYPITYCHTELKDGTMCKNIPIYACLTIPQCASCHNESLKNFDDVNPMIKESLDKQGKGVSD